MTNQRLVYLIVLSINAFLVTLASLRETGFLRMYELSSLMVSLGGLSCLRYGSADGFAVLGAARIGISLLLASTPFFTGESLDISIRIGILTSVATLAILETRLREIRLPQAFIIRRQET